MTAALSGRPQHALNGADHAVELGLLSGELPAARDGERVVACAAVVLRAPPLGFHAAAEQQSLERGVQRTLPDTEHVARCQTQVLDNAVAVLGPAPECLQDQELERSWQEIRGRIGQSHQSMMGIYRKRSKPVNCHQWLRGLAWRSRAATWRLARPAPRESSTAV